MSETLDSQSLKRAYEAVNSELSRHVKALAAREKELQQNNIRFEAALSNMAQGLCMFDAELRIVACNEQYRSLFKTPFDVAQPGSSLRDIVEFNVRAGRHPGETVDEVMSHRLEIFNQGEPAVLKTRVDGERIVEVSYRPISNGGWVVTYDDITERENAKRALDEQYRRFDAALNNMPHGLCMFDAGKRLIVCNNSYTKMYHLPPELTAPGVTLQQIIEYRTQTGQGPHDTNVYWQEQIKRAVEGKFSSYKLFLKDGRTIQIDHQPLPGGGWVANHQDVSESIRAAEQINHMARHDALTGLANRAVFRSELEASLKRALRGDPLAVLCLDLDHFKAVNDTLGHLVGDELLKAVAVRLHDCVRETDLVARLGGDEFAIIQVGGAQPSGATGLASRLIETLGQSFSLGDHTAIIGASVGISIGPNDGITAEELLKNADLALYRAKEDGRATYCFFEPDMNSKMQARRSLEMDLRQALANDQFKLHYQPQVGVSSQQVVGFEALIRWHHPERGLVPPSDFISVAEETGLINAIGAWVLNAACREAATWPEHVRVAVNLSPIQFKGGTLLLDVMSALGKSGLSPTRLELEITETVMLSDTEGTLDTLRQLKEIGISISMDDFGTGYSSLGYLRKFPFSKIKIDQSFIRSLSSEQESVAIVKAITGLGQSLGMLTTAEGVETVEQMDALRAEGCTEVQGYYLSRPVPASEVLALLGQIPHSLRDAAVDRNQVAIEGHFAGHAEGAEGTFVLGRKAG
jgi:diguanylate cyclase (GGDEF)-like protein